MNECMVGETILVVMDEMLNFMLYFFWVLTFNYIIMTIYNLPIINLSQC